MKNSTILIAIGKDASLDDLARKFETIRTIPAQVAILLVGEVPQFPYYAVCAPKYGGADIPPEWLEALSRINAALKAKQEEIETLLQKHDVSGEVAVVATERSQISDAIGRRAMLCDLALISDATSEFEAGDAFSYARAAPNLTDALSGPGSTSVKLAFWKTPGWDLADDKAQAALSDFASGLGRDCSPVEIAAAQNVSVDHKYIQAAENAHYYGPLYDRDKSLLTDDLRGRMAVALETSARDYLGAVERRDQHYRAVADVLDQFDAILCLSAAGPAAHGYASTGNPVFNGLWTYLGVPCISLPLLTIDDMPLGVQLVGKRREEAKLLQTAKWLEGRVSA